MNNSAFSQEARLDAFRKAQSKSRYSDQVEKYFQSEGFYSLHDAKRWNTTFGYSVKRVCPEDQKRIDRVFNCGSTLGVVYSPSLNKSHTISKWCDERCCPLCNFYKSRSLFNRVYNYVKDHPDRRYAFLTLTVKNVSAAELRDTVKRMNRAFGRMFKLSTKDSKVSRYFTGYLRRLEVTYNINENSKSYRTFHPHFHVLLECSPEYKPNTDCFYHYKDILSDWQRYYGDPDICEVDIEEVKAKEDPRGFDHGLAKAVAEVAKYPMKFTPKLMVPENSFLLDEYVAGMFTLKGCIFESASKNFKPILHFVQKPQEGDELPKVIEAPDAAVVGAYFSRKSNQYIFTNIHRLDEQHKMNISVLSRLEAWYSIMSAYEHGLIESPPDDL